MTAAITLTRLLAAHIPTARAAEAAARIVRDWHSDPAETIHLIATVAGLSGREAIGVYRQVWRMLR